MPFSLYGGIIMVNNKTKPLALITGTINNEVVPALNGFCEIRQWTKSAIMPKAEIIKAIAEVDVLIVAFKSIIDKDVLTAAKNLKIVVQPFIGYESVDVAACTAKGIPFCNTASQSAASVAELAMALIQMSARNLPECMNLVKSISWHEGYRPPFTFGQELQGMTLGILGMGHIGSHLASIARGYGLHIIYHNRHESKNIMPDLAKYVDINTLFKNADFLVNALPANQDTVHYVDKQLFQFMKSTSVFINVGRGNTIITDDLVEALQKKYLSKAALDVTDPEPLPINHPLLHMPNVILTPHIGGSTATCWRAKGQEAAENIIRFYMGQSLKDCLNPEVLK